MVRQRVNIRVRGRRWRIIAFYPLTRYHVDEIIDALRDMECENEYIAEAYNNLTSGNVGNGITYSNSRKRETVVVFAFSKSPAQYFNLIVHELHHLAVHIALANGYPLDGEEVCYINGDIAEMMYPVCRKLI